ncbi:transcriptional regulator, MerR family [Arcobacter venerupis]|uniref:Transcriptional regulator, MerR family n=1 Tax=Arcobacter venerupis TaxID=1054033 RepID=A0AAE7BCE0_9BACT|nr:MerR family transcriptional regulator [Arcobacter venerupis]QKF67804.1 transcriptional regulator, MerR family [Arcobacter venerupis]RWS49412.1 MerR family transcriptional regulator [Arcobacter venerupis]
MALLDNDKDILPLSSISELLSAKIRTLKMYEEKGLLPQKNQKIKKLYSINDVKIIAFVHYLANIKKINANGIKYILEMISENMDEQNRNVFLEIVESKLENVSGNEIQDLESF